MYISSFTPLTTNLTDLGKSITLAPPYDHDLGMLLGWVIYWFWFGIAISLASNILLGRILKWQFNQFVVSTLAMSLGSLVGTLVAGASIMILGYNIGLFLSFSISGALFGLSFGSSRWIIIRRYMPETKLALVFSVVGWALGWSTWYLPESFSTETATFVGFVIVVITELLTLYWLYRKNLSTNVLF